MTYLFRLILRQIIALHLLYVKRPLLPNLYFILGITRLNLVLPFYLNLLTLYWKFNIPLPISTSQNLPVNFNAFCLVDGFTPLKSSLGNHDFLLGIAKFWRFMHEKDIRNAKLKSGGINFECCYRIPMYNLHIQVSC